MGSQSYTTIIWCLFCNLCLMGTIIVSNDIIIGIIVGGCALALQVILVLCWHRIINRIDRKNRRLKSQELQTRGIVEK